MQILHIFVAPHSPSGRPGETAFERKAGGVIPRIIVLNDDIDPTDNDELIWAFATRCHPLLGNVTFDHIPAAPLLAYLRKSEKISSTTGKVVYNCLPPDEWGDALPVRASFRHGYPKSLTDQVIVRWQDYGFIRSYWIGLPNLKKAGTRDGRRGKM